MILDLMLVHGAAEDGEVTSDEPVEGPAMERKLKKRLPKQRG
jgi:hypothetical protein